MIYRTFATLFTGLVLLSFVLAGVNWQAAPEKSGAWLVSVGFMVFVRVFIGWLQRSRPLENFGAQERRFFVGTVLIAGGMIIISLVQQLPVFAGAEEGRPMSRATGVFFGLILALTGNFIPKVLRPLSASSTASPACESPVRRFAGIVFFVTGLVYMAAWLFLPRAYAGDVATMICFGGTVLVLGRFVWTFRQRTS